MKNIHPILLLALGCGQKAEEPFGEDVRHEPCGAFLQAEFLARTSAEIDFCAPIPALKEAGHIGALLQY